MNCRSINLIYFSPTGTTRKILAAIAQGAAAGAVKHIDLTRPQTVAPEAAEIHAGLSVIGAPVYGGRLPAEAVSRMSGLKGNGAPAVIVVVYGNRAYEDALLELRDLVFQAGFKPIGAGAFIGEHSYSINATPIAAGRPDNEDLRKAEEFGKEVRHRISRIEAPEKIPPLRVPGNYPYQERRILSNIVPLTRGDACVRCETCVSVCPVAAITIKESVTTEPGLCIRCCACVKNCPAGAREMADARIRQAAAHLSANCARRKDPETYLVQLSLVKE